MRSERYLMYKSLCTNDCRYVYTHRHSQTQHTAGTTAGTSIHTGTHRLSTMMTTVVLNTLQ